MFRWDHSFADQPINCKKRQEPLILMPVPVCFYLQNSYVFILLVMCYDCTNENKMKFSQKNFLKF